MARSRPSDVSMSSWALPEANRLEELRAATIELHHDALLTQGVNGDVIESAESAVVEHPLREKLWGQLMLALYRSGRQADALHACKRLRTQLVEIGLEPNRDVLRLEDDILAQKPELDWTGLATEIRGRLRPPRTDSRPSGDAAVLPDQLATRSEDFVGRESELSLMDQLRKEVISDARPRIVLVTGEPGIGKSSLAAAAARSAFRDGTVVVYGHSDPYLNIPYQPWREALDQLFGGLAPPGGTEPVEVDPVLRAFGLGAPPASDSSHQRTRTSTCCTRLCFTPSVRHRKAAASYSSSMTSIGRIPTAFSFFDVSSRDSAFPFW